MYWHHISSNQGRQRNVVDHTQRVVVDLMKETKGNETPPSRQDLTDGQISIALNSDLMDLINNITHEMELTSSKDAGLLDPMHGNNDVMVTAKVGRTQTELSFGGSTTARTHSTGSSMRDMSPRHREMASDNWRSLEPINASWLGAAPVTAEARSSVNQGSLSSSPRHGSHMSTASTDLEPLPQVLDQLDDEDDDCIVVVRRITKLGFKSNRIIKAAFNEHGWKVKNVVLLPSRSKTLAEDSHTITTHARPSSMGFAVFADKKHAQACLKQGTHLIEGIEILVQPFSRQYKPGTSPTHAMRTST